MFFTGQIVIYSAMGLLIHEARPSLKTKLINVMYGLELLSKFIKLFTVENAFLYAWRKPYEDWVYCPLCAFCQNRAAEF